MSGTLVPVQQRRIMRRAIRVECQIVRERDFRLVGSRALDLSPQGMLVMTQAPILTGEPLIVCFKLPMSDWWFDTEATVARVVHGRRPGDRGRAFGLEFETLEPQAQAFLRRALRGVPPPLPMREPRTDYAASVHYAALS
jgi:c-di-GMP-binding flagellar brake protein YcgR